MRALEGRWGHALAVGILLIVPLVFFWEMIVENQEPLAPDTQAARPLGHWAIEAQEQIGEVPLWCPGIFSGMPSYGSFIYTPSSPLDLTRWVRYPFSDQRGMRYYLSLLLGALSLYLLLVRRRLAPLSALVGTLAFVMTPYFLGLIAAGHSTKLQALCLAPLVFLALDLLLQKRSLSAAGFLGAAVALQFWNNHPQISYYTLMIGGLYLLLTLFFDRPERWRGRWLLGGVALALLGLLLGAGLVLEPYAVVLEYTPHSIRGDPGALQAAGAGAGAGWGYATAWSFPPAELVTFLFPAWFGLEGQTYWGALPFTQSTHYFGITILLLVMIALLFGRDRRRWLLLILAGVVLLLGFGRHLPLLFWPAFKLLPHFSSFRVPSMIYALLPLLLGMLAAQGLQIILHPAGSRLALPRLRGGAPIQGPPSAARSGAGRRSGHLGRHEPARGVTKRASAGVRGETRQTRFTIQGWTWTLITIPLVILWALVAPAIGDALLGSGAFLKAGEIGRAAPGTLAQLARVRIDLWSQSVTLGLLLLALGAAIIEIRRRGRIPAALAGLMLTGLVIADLWIIDRKFYDPRPGHESAAVLQPDEVIRFLQTAQPPLRIAPLTRAGFGSNRYAAFGLESIGGYQPAKLRIYNDLIESGALFSPGVLAMLNVQYILADASLADRGFPLLKTARNQRGETVCIHRNPGMLPRAWFAAEVRTAGDAAALLARIQDPSFDPRRTAWLYEDEVGLVPDTLSVGEVLIEGPGPWLREFTVELHETAFTVRVAGPHPALLVLSEIFYPPGWEATIDDEPVAIVRANHVLRALWVPPGDHQIRLRAVSPALERGVRASRLCAVLVGLLLITGLVNARWRRREGRAGAVAAPGADR
ncbi:MAG: hypothetical protein KAY32_04970 [Candidatus Eisenbacteria sp.]|nr:hypothetical protein [Candidatus Eisenbacteria bacterium]